MNPSATANYQSGQFTLEKRFTHGLQLQANYTWSHTIRLCGVWNDRIHQRRLRSGLRSLQPRQFVPDVPQVFIANFIYQTPSLAGWNGATKALWAAGR